MARNDLNNILFSFKIESIEELKSLLEDVCIIGGDTRLVSFEIKDWQCMIRYLDDECALKVFYLDLSEDKYIDAVINGRNRHGKRVNYVKEAEVISVNMTYEVHNEYTQEWEEGILTFSAVIDDIKVNNITKYLKGQ